MNLKTRTPICGTVAGTELSPTDLTTLVERGVSVGRRVPCVAAEGSPGYADGRAIRPGTGTVPACFSAAAAALAAGNGLRGCHDTRLSAKRKELTSATSIAEEATVEAVFRRVYKTINCLFLVLQTGKGSQDDSLATMAFHRVPQLCHSLPPQT